MSGGFPTNPQYCNSNDCGTAALVSMIGGNAAWGSYSQIVASTPTDCALITLITACNEAVMTGNGGAVKFATGAAGSEIDFATIVIGASGGSWRGTGAILPVTIRAGTRIAAAAASQAGTTDTFYGAITIFDGSPVLLQAAGTDTVGFKIPNGTNIPSTNVWTQIIASTVRDYCGFYAFMDNGGASITNSDFTVDIGIGSAGSEQMIFDSFRVIGSGVNFANTSAGPFFIPIPAGSRLSARQGSATSIGITILGMYE